MNKRILTLLVCLYSLAGCQSVNPPPQNEKLINFNFSEFSKIAATCYTETHKSIYTARTFAAGLKSNHELLSNLNSAYEIDSERNSDVVNWVLKRDNSTPESRDYIYRDAPLHCTESFLGPTNGQEVEMAKSCVNYANLPWLMSALKKRGATREDFTPFAMYKLPNNNFQSAYMVAYNKAINTLYSDNGEKYNPEQHSKFMLTECYLWIMRASNK